mmetsp:Transcript_28484/g.94540  ORF Transcript_28484/g.94540 Transcript_28484/m.94540 type:complete len:380 (+) Transcript_28484:221-1360(+)
MRRTPVAALWPMPAPPINTLSGTSEPAFAAPRPPPPAPALLAAPPPIAGSSPEAGEPQAKASESGGRPSNEERLGTAGTASASSSDGAAAAASPAGAPTWRGLRLRARAGCSEAGSAPASAFAENPPYFGCWADAAAGEESGTAASPVSAAASLAPASASAALALARRAAAFKATRAARSASARSVSSFSLDCRSCSNLSAAGPPRRSARRSETRCARSLSRRSFSKRSCSNFPRLTYSFPSSLNFLAFRAAEPAAAASSRSMLLGWAASISSFSQAPLSWATSSVALICCLALWNPSMPSKLASCNSATAARTAARASTAPPPPSAAISSFRRPSAAAQVICHTSPPDRACAPERARARERHGRRRRGAEGQAAVLDA